MSNQSLFIGQKPTHRNMLAVCVVTNLISDVILTLLFFLLLLLLFLVNLAFRCQMRKWSRHNYMWCLSSLLKSVLTSFMMFTFDARCLLLMISLTFDSKHAVHHCNSSDLRWQSICSFWYYIILQNCWTCRLRNTCRWGPGHLILYVQFLVYHYAKLLDFFVVNHVLLIVSGRLLLLGLPAHELTLSYHDIPT